MDVLGIYYFVISLFVMLAVSSIILFFRLMVNAYAKLTDKDDVTDAFQPFIYDNTVSMVYDMFVVLLGLCVLAVFRGPGDWYNDKRRGKGTMVYANVVYANGDKYEGDGYSDVRHTEGTMVYANGEKYEGDML
jgi:hypothetical protein